MSKRQTRRQFLTLGATGVLWGTSSQRSVGRGAKIPTPQSAYPKRYHERSSSRVPVDVRGAIYVPTRAFNRYQMWRDYDPEEVERDLGYAASLNLNAIRTWLSYEYWLAHPNAHQNALEHLLDTAKENGIRVLLGLFDGVGEEPTVENLLDTDPITAVQVYSPSLDVMKDLSLWERPREFIRRFMSRYSDDDRLLAIELTNEPGWYKERIQFARGMMRTFTANRGSVPLTVGVTSLTNNLDFMDWDIDVLQCHYNFPQSPAIYHRVLREANHISSGLNKPVWLSEWQRIRPGKRFFSNVSGDDRFPDYSSLAPIIHSSGIGNFFWSLMIKPAFAVRLRRMGVINGLFHEDGAVWSLEDARAIKAMSGDSIFTGAERREYPEWMGKITDERAIQDSN